MVKKIKQSINSNEPYFVHIGYTYANEIKKTKKRSGGRYVKLNIKHSVQNKLKKLYKYWRMSLK